MKTKKLMSILLSIALVLSVINIAPVYAEGNTWDVSVGGDGSVTATYDETTKTLTVSGNGDMAKYSTTSLPPYNDYLSSIENVVIEDGVTNIGNRAFKGSSSLTSVKIGNNVTSIGEYAFSDCKGLVSVEIPDSVTTINGRAFKNCSSLTSIEIPDSVTELKAKEIFYNCTALNTFTWNAYPVSIDTSVSIFKGMGSSALGEKTAYINPTNADLMTTLQGLGYTIVDGSKSPDPEPETPSLSWDVSMAQDGSVTATYDETTKTLTVSGNGAIKPYRYPNNPPYQGYTGNIVIEDGVTSIGYMAFAGCSFTSVEIPSTTSIEENAFNACPIKTFTWSAYPASFDTNAFGTMGGYMGSSVSGEKTAYIDIRNESLKTTLKGLGYTIVDTSPALTSWDVSAAQDGSAMATLDETTKTLTVSGSGPMMSYVYPKEAPYKPYYESIETVVIENGVTSIGDSAFEIIGSKITSVEVPDSVTSIGSRAFAYNNYVKTFTWNAYPASFDTNALTFYNMGSYVSGEKTAYIDTRNTDLKTTLEGLGYTIVDNSNTPPSVDLDASAQHGIDSDGNGTSEVIVTTEAIQMTVTVPVYLPVSVDAAGNVTTATNAKIVNKSYAPVVVAETAAITPNGSWTAQSWDHNFSKDVIGTKNFAISLNGENSDSASVHLGDSTDRTIYDNYDFTYGVKISGQRTPLSNEKVADVVFTISWAGI